MSTSITALAGIVRLVPPLFHRLRVIGDGLHAGHGVTTPMRGVMQSLFDGGPQTVPQMAAARPVSRQHIQTQVDALAALCLVEIVPNPAHKRSSRIVLTGAGRQLFETMRAREMAVLAGLVGSLSLADLEVTRQTLTTLADQFAVLADETKEMSHDD